MKTKPLPCMLNDKYSYITVKVFTLIVHTTCPIIATILHREYRIHVAGFNSEPMCFATKVDDGGKFYWYMRACVQELSFFCKKAATITPIGPSTSGCANVSPTRGNFSAVFDRAVVRDHRVPNQYIR